MRKKLAALAYGITAVVSIVMGSIYLFKFSFMPYHAAAVSRDWTEMESSYQILISALMTVAGGGWISVGIAILALLIFPFKNDQKWVIFFIPFLILLFYIPNLWATLYVLKNTPASPPWYGNAIACVSAAAGFLLYPKPINSE